MPLCCVLCSLDIFKDPKDRPGPGYQISTAGTGNPELTCGRVVTQEVFITPPAESQSTSQIRNIEVIIKCHEVNCKSHGDSSKIRGQNVRSAT